MQCGMNNTITTMRFTLKSFLQIPKIFTGECKKQDPLKENKILLNLFSICFSPTYVRDTNPICFVSLS